MASKTRVHCHEAVVKKVMQVVRRYTVINDFAGCDHRSKSNGETTKKIKVLNYSPEMPLSNSQLTRVLLEKLTPSHT